MKPIENARILVIDDNTAIHEDFKKLLSSRSLSRNELDQLDAELFDIEEAEGPLYEVDTAKQGAEGFTKVATALTASKPFAMAFVDMRMPPGWDGLKTISRIREITRDLPIVICTAYSDHSWGEIIAKLGRSDDLFILKKPFDPMEVQQLACALVEKTKLSQKVRLHTDELEQLIKERTRELEEARQSAESANSAKSEFLANMSHEIRTPMTAILGYADILEDELWALNPPEECVDSLATIKRNGKHLLELVNDVLDVSKIEAGKLEIVTGTCSLFGVVDDVIKLLNERAESKGLRLSFELEGRLPRQIETDETRLRQILINLVGNAVKFTDKGEVKVVGRFSRSEDGQGEIEFDVVDTGVGMTDDQAAKAFEPFSQVDESATRRFGGTGLGLTISRKLAEALGGGLSSVCVLGEGCCFRITLPTGPVDESDLLGKPEAAASRNHSRHIDTDGKRPALDCRVLLAEDGPDNRALISLTLKKAGVQVETCENGKEAVERVLNAERDGQPFVVVLMDMEMPVMDGYDATRYLREQGYTRPIVALTAHAMSSARRKCIDAGCDDYASKPIDRERLIELVADYANDSDVNSDAAEARVIRVLAAEDNPTNLHLIVRILRSFGMEVGVAENGKVARESAMQALSRSAPFDVILMDMHMPVQDGVSATRQLREEGYTGAIVALTANASESQRRECLESGCDEYLTKPIDATQLIDAICKYSDRNARPAVPTENETQVEPRTVAESAHKSSLNIDALLRRLNGDGHLLLETAVLFVEYAPQLVRDLESALVEDDPQTVHNSAHSIKGALADFTARGPYLLAESLESFAAEGDLQSVSERLPEFKASVEILRDELRSFATREASDSSLDKIRQLIEPSGS